MATATEIYKAIADKIRADAAINHPGDKSYGDEANLVEYIGVLVDRTTTYAAQVKGCVDPMKTTLLLWVSGFNGLLQAMQIYNNTFTCAKEMRKGYESAQVVRGLPVLPTLSLAAIDADTTKWFINVQNLSKYCQWSPYDMTVPRPDLSSVLKNVYNQYVVLRDMGATTEPLPVVPPVSLEPRVKALEDAMVAVKAALKIS
jgi:hypothetical protein